jgi:hypothetical protein
MPHPLQIPWILSQSLLTEFEHSLRLFLRHASGSPRAATEAEYFAADHGITLQEFGRAYHSFCFLNAKNVENIVGSVALVEEEGFQLAQRQDEEFIGLRLSAEPTSLSNNNSNDFAAFIERRCQITRLKTDRVTMTDFMHEVNQFVHEGRRQHIKEIGKVWKERDKGGLSYW